jgi:hypothetical protein
MIIAKNSAMKQKATAKNEKNTHYHEEKRNGDDSKAPLVYIYYGCMQY